MPTASCGECEWSHRADDDATTELDLAMIDHHVETGHSPIKRADLVEPILADELDGVTGSDRERGAALETGTGTGTKTGTGTGTTPESETETEAEPTVELEKN
ncbi:hypothetical protein [Natrialba aegyptia]|uniref:Uncharacterized protein n=1 Tax=Natrialba aegyptia DSM 13077 TaxID=1227491 RepID=M0BL00_9EURY|nr:hypothetical protein [Natrialba aegyptia]ELZ11515.1 hypothetical protein C480_00432 [Natrialba aegyptia DSM 13077]